MNIAIQSIAKALIINDRNEALILRLSEHRSRPENSFKSDLPGGIVDTGESERMAAIREIFEETGLTIEPSAVALVYSATAYYEATKNSVTKQLYIIRLDSTPEISLSWEHQSFEWVPLGVLSDAVPLAGFYKSAIEYCFKHDII